MKASTTTPTPTTSQDQWIDTTIECDRSVVTQFSELTDPRGETTGRCPSVPKFRNGTPMMMSRAALDAASSRCPDERRDESPSHSQQRTLRRFQSPFSRRQRGSPSTLSRKTKSESTIPSPKRERPRATSPKRESRVSKFLFRRSEPEIVINDDENDSLLANHNNCDQSPIVIIETNNNASTSVEPATSHNTPFNPLQKDDSNNNNDHEQQESTCCRTTGWHCQHCTFHNARHEFLTCEMCGLARDQEEAPESSQQQQQQQQQQQSSSANTSSTNTAVEVEQQFLLSLREQREQEWERRLIQQRLEEIVRLQQQLQVQHELQQQQQQQQQQQAEKVRRVVPNTSRMSQPGAVSAPGPNSVSAMSKMDLLQQEREALERRQREIEAQNARRPAPVSSGMRQLSDELSELEERQRELMLNQQRQERSLLSSTIPHEISTDARSSSVSSLESWRIQNGNGQRVDDSRRDAQQSALGMIDNGPQPGAVLSIRAEQSRQLEKLNQSHGDSEQRQREIQDQTNSRPGVVHSKQARALEKINLDRRGVAYAQQQQSTEMEQQNRERIEAERRKLELARQTRGSAIETTQPPPTISPVASQRRRGRENVDRSQFEQEGTQQTPSSRPGAVSVGAQQARELQKIRSSNERPSLPGTVSAAGAQQARALQKIQSSNERPRVQPGAVSAASAQQARELQKMQSSNQKHQNRDEEKTQSEDSSRSSLSSAKKLQVERDAIQQVQNLNLSSNFNYDSDELAEFQEAAMAMNKVRQRKRSSPKQRSKKPEPRPSRQDEIFQSMHSVDSYGDVAEFEEAAKAMNTITERVITNATGQSNRRIQGTPDADLPRTTRPGITSVRADDSEGSIRQLRERQKQLSVSLHSSVHSTEVMPLRSDHSQASASLTSSEIFVTAKDNPPRPKLGVRATSDKTSLAIEPSQLPAKSYRQYTLRQEQPQPPSMPTTTEPGHRNGQISRTDRFARIPSESSRLNAAPPRRQPSDDGEELDT